MIEDLATMIVDKMLPWNVCSQLEQDAVKVNYMAGRYLKQAVKHFKGVASFPSWVYYKYTVPDTLNTYVIYYYAATRANANNPLSDSFAFLDLKEKTVMRVYHLDTEDGEKRRFLQEIRPHFFERYRERVLRNPEINFVETACRFFTKNSGVGIVLDTNEQIQKSIQKYGNYSKNVFLFPEGIGLGQTAELYEWENKEVPMPPGTKGMTWYYLSTFVSNEMLYENQTDGLAQLVFEYVESIKRTVQLSPVDDFEGIVMLNNMQKDPFKKIHK